MPWNVISTKSLLGKFLLKVPMWLAPYYLHPARVGRDVKTYVKIVWRY